MKTLNDWCDRYFGWLFWLLIAGIFAFFYLGPLPTNGDMLASGVLAVGLFFAAGILFAGLASIVCGIGLALQGVWYVITAVREKMRRESIVHQLSEERQAVYAAQRETRRRTARRVLPFRRDTRAGQ